MNESLQVRVRWVGGVSDPLLLERGWAFAERVSDASNSAPLLPVPADETLVEPPDPSIWADIAERRNP